ncbi:MAG: hypothetical protein KDK34_22125 [Leptospiraceae bacterium]|nr:hypothetical protein [Leptospiraceae bacterium]
MKKRSTSIIILLLLLVLSASTLQAETLILKSGQQVEGRILSQTRTEVRIRTANGVQVISKTDIRRILYNDQQIQEEARRQEELRRQQEEERRRQEEEARRQAEETQRQEEEAQRQAEEARRQAEEEARRRAEENANVEQDQEPKVTVWNSLLRSAILPGWGQIHSGRSGSGWMIMGGFLGAAGLSLYLDDQYYLARRNYENDANEFFYTSPLLISSLGQAISDTSQFIPIGVYIIDKTSTSRQKMEQAGRYANGMRSALLALYVWNLLDVVLFYPDQNSTVGLEIHGDRLGMRYELRF